MHHTFSSFILVIPFHCSVSQRWVDQYWVCTFWTFTFIMLELELAATCCVLKKHKKQEVRSGIHEYKHGLTAPKTHIQAL